VLAAEEAATSHHAIAAAVAQGRDDFGIAIDIVARDRDLGFLPIAEERDDFFVPTSRLERPAVRASLEEIERPETRARLRARGLRV
jgi:putative molybdopterin biosynthesis protein